MMFKPSACFKAVPFVWLIAAMRFGAVGGLWFAVVPFGFGIAGLLERWRG